jgi:hypothetical protein
VTYSAFWVVGDGLRWFLRYLHHAKPARAKTTTPPTTPPMTGPMLDFVFTSACPPFSVVVTTAPLLFVTRAVVPVVLDADVTLVLVARPVSLDVISVVVKLASNFRDF